MFTFGERLHVYRATLAQDRYGNTTPSTWQLVAMVDGGFAPTSGVRGQVGSTREDTTQGREAVISDASVYVACGADVRAGDRIEVRGSTYEAVGDPAEWVNPFTGWAAGAEIRLRRVAG